MYGLKAVPFKEVLVSRLEKRTSAAKAVKFVTIYGTAAAVPFV
jgi:hypothetical protein